MPCLPTGNHWEAGRQVDNKSMQWFGASVTSRSGVIVVSVPFLLLEGVQRVAYMFWVLDSVLLSHLMSLHKAFDNSVSAA